MIEDRDPRGWQDEELEDDLEEPDAGNPFNAAKAAETGSSRIDEIILEAQRSARQFVDEARQQSSLLIEEADRQTRAERAELITGARGQVDGLAETAAAMLESLNEITGQLDEIVSALRESSDRLANHVDELLVDSEESQPLETN